MLGPRRSSLEQKDRDYQQQQQYYDEDPAAQSSSSTHASTVQVTLDAPVMPAPVHPLLVGTAVTFLVLTAIAVVARLPALFSALGRGLGGLLSGFAGAGSRLNIGGAMAEAQYRARLALGSLQAAVDDFKSAIDRRYGPEVSAVPMLSA